MSRPPLLFQEGSGARNHSHFMARPYRAHSKVLDLKRAGLFRHPAAESSRVRRIIDHAADFSIYSDDDGIRPKRVGRRRRNVLTAHAGQGFV